MSCPILRRVYAQKKEELTTVSLQALICKYLMKFERRFINLCPFAKTVISYKIRLSLESLPYWFVHV